MPDPVMQSDDDNQPWNSYRRLVLSELARIDRSLGEMNQRLAEALDAKSNEIRTLQVDMATMKTQVAAWGAVAGVLGAGVIEVFLRFVKW